MTCSECDGEGTIACDEVFDPYDGFAYAIIITCPTCNGEREIEGESDDPHDEA